ncbi:hypothetical protein [Bacillus gaemokensis]|uniref:HNH nuclease domain-containing protein n=1 Tax=Bacillus gaemokensis TaxID=574375 RepID=A0A073K9E8_9BACI|nr:hypothetical protein [Bacillus gaemokensis]KEK23904.1 hypothetical protein BAGA_05590 [Bacillus gaemokensis]KYG38147.1 hypothetical protein AZF08_20585 [Bacillus gaemokensis]
MLEHTFKTGRRYFTDEQGEVVLIECGNCKDVKGLNEFPRQSTCKKTGRRSFCETCHKNRKKAYYQENKDTLRYYHERKDDKEYMDKRAKWREDNKEHLSNYNKQYHKEKKDKVSKRKRDYCSREEVKSHRTEYMKLYRKTEDGKEAFKRGMSNRRMAKNNTPVTIDCIVAIKDFKSLFGNVCCFTGLKILEESTEHMLPVTRGGGNTEYNIAPSELSLNRSKNNRNIFDWIELLEEDIDFSFFYESTIPYLAEKMGVSIEEYVLWYEESYEEKLDVYHMSLVES